MGLLDYLTKDPDQQAALMQGLLGGAFGAMAGRGSRLQAWGQGGLTGLQSYTGARESQAQAKRAGLQDQFLQMQMKDRERAQADDEARRKAVQGAMIQPSLPSTMDARDIGQPGEQQLLPTFDMGRYATNLAQIGSPDALGAFQALQPKRERMKVGVNERVLDENGRVIVDAVPEQPKVPDSIRQLEMIYGKDSPQFKEALGRLGQKLTTHQPATSVNVNADKGFAGAFGKNVADALQSTLEKGVAAEASSATVADIREALNSGKVILGPGAQLRQGGLRIGQIFGAGSQDSADTLAKTRKVQQGLAQIELDAAQLMKGQGQITEAERGIIRRAAAGEIQDMTESELNVVLGAIERNNKRAISRATSQAQTVKDNPAIGSLGGLIQPPAEPEKVRRYNPNTGKIE